MLTIVISSYEFKAVSTWFQSRNIPRKRPRARSVVAWCFWSHLSAGWIMKLQLSGDTAHSKRNRKIMKILLAIACLVGLVATFEVSFRI